MGLAAAILAFGGAISFLLGAASGFWLDGWMRRHPSRGPDRYRMVLHKEALWSSFLCFAVAGWIDRLPMPGWAALLLALGLVATGWGACWQYFCVARAGLKDAYAEREAIPAAARLGGALAMAGNLGAIALLLWGTGRALLDAALR